MRLPWMLLCAAVALKGVLVSAAEEPQELAEERKQFTRLQIFLDNQEFNPGIIDGRWGEYTRKALAAYYKANGKPFAELGGKPPQEFDLPLEQVEPLFTSYTITEEDASRIGSVPEEPQEQAQKKQLPYTSLLELVAERFHADSDFVREINPKASFEVGETVTVPNVQKPFSISEVEKRAEERKEKARSAEENGAKDSQSQTSEEKSATTEEERLKIHISTRQRTLELRDGGKTIAFYPITPGSEALPAPTGEWKITSITWMPWFRYDEKMLQEGERGEEAYNIPPGPNNAVGIVWMALNKKGVGIHGTKAPETIGRTTSHGCIRLSNWDAWDLGNRVSDGTRVIID